MQEAPAQEEQAEEAAAPVEEMETEQAAEAELEAEAADEAAEAEAAAEPEASETGSQRSIEAPKNPNIPEIRPGDSVAVHAIIREGDRERVQEFRGTVIRLRKGGNNANFTVRRTASHGVGVERTFLLRSPLLEKVEIVRRAKVRKAQLYYLRERAGKRARLKERREG
jgi:large subunit ribosomal protein L19